MMDSPFEAAFRASANGPIDGRPLGLRLLACLLIPPAIVLAAIAPAGQAHGRPTRPAEGFGAVLPQAPTPRPADGAIFIVSD